MPPRVRKMSVLQDCVVILKPDAIKRRLMPKILQRFEDRGLEMTQGKLVFANNGQVIEHYKDHMGLSHFEKLRTSMQEGVLFVCVYTGVNAIAACRQILGKTNPLEAAPGTIRGDYALEMPYTVAHASDSDAAYEREYKIWFSNVY